MVKRRVKLRFYLFLVLTLCIISTVYIHNFFELPFSHINEQFDYLTVIYPSPFEINRTCLSIYFTKKDRLSYDEDQVSIRQHHKYIDEGIRELNKKEYLLVEYTHIFGQKKFCSKTNNEIFGDQCPYQNCFYSCNRSLASQAQLLLFHKYDVSPTTVPSKSNFTRHPEQIWLLWHDEPNFVHGYNLNIYQFNWTTSYVFDAEAAIGAYGMTIVRKQPWSESELDRYIKIEFHRRRNRALWFVTNCGAKRRLAYFLELRKLFPIRVFGSCVKNNESLPSETARIIARSLIKQSKMFEDNTNDSISSLLCKRESSCENEQLNNSKFYLSFESQSCKDYISEKFWRAFKFGLIPIALGPLSKQYYRRIAPPNSFIYVGDFSNTEALARHLYDIINDEQLFRHYHQWRQFYLTGYSATENEKYRFCEVCHRLNTMTRRQHYTDVRAFFTQQC